MRNRRKPRPEDYHELRSRMRAQQRETKALLCRIRNWESCRKKRMREGYAFIRITGYLRRQAKEIFEEHRITALYGCETSWPRVERAAIYTFVAEGENEHEQT